MKDFRIVCGMVVAFVVVMAMGCVEEFDAGTSGNYKEGLVVEGDIISDTTVVFRLSKTLPLEQAGDKTDYMTVDAEVSVKGSDGTSWVGFRNAPGEYHVEVGTLKPDVEYHLEILYKGETYLSEPQKPLETVGIEDVSFIQPDLEGAVIVQLDTQKGDSPQYYLWYYEEDWEVRAHFQTKALYDPIQDKIINYDYAPVARGWCHNSSSVILSGTTEANVEHRVVGKTIQTIENDDHRLCHLYSIRVQQRNLTRKEYEYYQVRSKLNYEMGGLFSPQPSELPTNITCSDPSCKVIGYVGCNMGVSYRQLYIKESDVAYIDNYMCEIGKAPSGSSKEKYEAGFQIGEMSVQGTEWAKIGCVDVRYWLADPMGRPLWWPED